MDVERIKTGCPSNTSCTSYNYGEGRKKCLECRPMEKIASEGNYLHSKGLLLDTEQIEEIADNQDMVSIFTNLSKVEPRDRAIFEDYTFGNVSMNNIARQHGLTRQQVHNIVKGVRIQIKKQMGLSTVI